MFRNTLKGDVEKAIPLVMPVLKDGNAPYRSHHRRQARGYFLIKKVLVDKEGGVCRATDEEIEEALKDTDEDDGIGGLTGPEYVYAVEEMFRRRR